MQSRVITALYLRWGRVFSQHHFSHGLTTASEGDRVAQAYLISRDCAGGGFVGVGGFTTGVSVS